MSPAIDDDSSVGRSRANERTEAVDTSRGRLPVPTLPGWKPTLVALHSARMRRQANNQPFGRSPLSDDPALGSYRWVDDRERESIDDGEEYWMINSRASAWLFARCIGLAAATYIGGWALSLLTISFQVPHG